MLRIILKEGRAIQATEDMRLFADEVVEELRQFAEEPLLILSEDGVFFWRKVVGPFQKPKLIGIMFRKLQRRGAMMGASETKSGSIIQVFYYLDNDGVPRFNPPNSNHMIHELIHCFDPKLEKNIDYKGSQNYGDGQTKEEYYKDESEQDAFMRQDAMYMASTLEKFPVEKVMEILKNKMTVPKLPGNARESRMAAWATDNKMWRKFINTVYDETVSRRIPKVGPSKFQQAKADKEGLTP